MKDFDQETKKILAEGDKMQEFVRSEGWDLAKKKLLEKLELLNSITNIPTESMDVEHIAKEVQLRAGVVSILQEWISEIEGIAKQSELNNKAVLISHEEQIITFKDD